MSDKITIVTAFFPLKRENWSKFKRPNSKYLEYFEFWSRIKNDMIIYTTPEMSEYVKQIRVEKFKRENTVIIPIDDWKNIDEELYNKISQTMESPLAINYKMHPTYPESYNADYNYITGIKSWFVYDSINRGLAKGMIAWVDFGYNHGGEYYNDPEDFDFEWKLQNNNKITLFTINDLDNLPIFEVCRRMNSYIQGGIMIGPDTLWPKFWELCRTSMIELANIGLSDDDQTISLMAYQKNKDIFELRSLKRWWSVFDSYNIKNFSIVPKKEKKYKKLREFKHLLIHRKNLKRYLKYWYNILKNEQMKG